MTWDEFLNNGVSDKSFGQVQTDIECPKCGRKIYFDKTVVLTTYPAKYSYWCTCGWSDVTAVKWIGGDDDETD